MKKIINHIKADISLANDTEIIGIISGSVNVNSNVTIVVKGIINGQIHIESGSNAIIYGIVNGNINNQGNCQIFGTINGHLYGGNYFIDPNAIIR